MSRSSRPRIAIGALVALATAGVAGYLAERRAVARWTAGVDPYRNEPSSLSGNERLIDGQNGARLRVVEIDAAPGSPTVILAHGFTACADQWAPVAERLGRRGIRVVAFDQRGHGGSSSGDGRFGTAQLADDLAAVVKETASQAAVLAGHSMGGIGVQAMLADHPRMADDLAGLVLLSTVARPVGVPLSTLMSRLGGTAIARRTMAHPLHGRFVVRGGIGRQPNATVLDVVRQGWAETSDDTRAGVMRDLRDFDFTEVLRNLEVPTTVICGDLDQVTPLEESRRIADLLQNGRLEIMFGCGHAITWEAADAVAEIIAGHVRRDRSRPHLHPTEKPSPGDRT